MAFSHHLNMSTVENSELTQALNSVIFEPFEDIMPKCLYTADLSIKNQGR